MRRKRNGHRREWLVTVGTLTLGLSIGVLLGLATRPRREQAAEIGGGWQPVDGAPGAGTARGAAAPRPGMPTADDLDRASVTTPAPGPEAGPEAGARTTSAPVRPPAETPR